VLPRALPLLLLSFSSRQGPRKILKLALRVSRRVQSGPSGKDVDDP
jgi:hypothetical protein